MGDHASLRYSRVFAVAFLVVGAFGVLASLPAVVSPEVEGRVRDAGREAQDRRGPLAAVLDGSWSSGFQSGFEDALPFRDGAVALWAAGRYALFRSGAPGVVVGDDGWLFTAEEFEAPADYEERLRGRLDRVVEVGNALDARGIDLVVALVPSKARVRPGPLRNTFLRRRPPAILAHRYSTALEVLSHVGIPAPDLRPALSSDGSFLRRDTHWSPLGAASAAGALGVPGRGALDRQMVPRSAFETLPGKAERHTGDLMAFLPLGPFAESFGLGPEEIRLFETRPVLPEGLNPGPGRDQDDRPAGGSPGNHDPLGLFETPTIPVALVGTSYSADPRWSFADFLQEALEAEVLTIAEEGKGPFEPMEAYLAGDTITEIPPRLVIWEIPERYLTVDPE